MKKKRSGAAQRHLISLEEDYERGMRALYRVARAVYEEPGAFPEHLAVHARRGDFYGLVDAVAQDEAARLRATRDRGGYATWSRAIGGFGPFTQKMRHVAAGMLVDKFAARENPSPRKGALIEVEKRDAGYFYRHPMGHLAGPFRARSAAHSAGALAFAEALNPGARRAEITELAAALLDEDPDRPFVRQFSDGWRVWDPARRLFLRAPDGSPFASRGEAERRRRELAGEATDDGPMFRRAAPAATLDLFAPRPARGGGGATMQQLGLFGARENPSPLEYFPLTETGVNEAGCLVYDGLQRIVAEHPGLTLQGRTRKAHGPYRRAHGFDLAADWIEKNPLLPSSSDFTVMVTTDGVWVESRDGRARMSGATPAEQADAALRTVRGWIKRSSRRLNPRVALRAETVPPPRTLVHVEIIPHAGTPQGTVLARFTAIPPHHGKGRAPRWSINALVGEANGFTFSRDFVIVPLGERDGPPPTVRAIAKLAELHHGDPKAYRAQVSVAPRENPSPALGPLRGGPGEAVTYRPRGDGTVLVRTCHAGAGQSEREMPLGAALEHRARLLRMGYRANPVRGARRARKAPAKHRGSRRSRSTSQR